MRALTLLAALSVLLYTAPLHTAAQSQLSCSAINSLALQLYTYAFPLLLMNATSQNSAQNSLVTALTQDPANHLVVKPNLDTAYTQGFFDVSQSSYLLQLPAFGSRYWIGQVLDAYSNTIADPGSRTIAGTTQYSMLLTGAQTDISGIPVNSTTQVVRSSTALNWVLGRTYQNGTAADLAIVSQLSKQWTVTTYPLNSNSPTSSNVAGPVLQNSSATANLTAPIVTVASLNASQYFTIASELLCHNPPAANDTAFVANVIDQLGFNPCAQSTYFGQTFINESAVYNCMPKNFTATAIQYLTGQAVALGKNTTINGWPYIVNNIGTYGTNYVSRAVIALIGLGANLPIDAVYLSATTDAGLRSLNASLPYTVTFANGNLPPAGANAFWSLTYYTSTSFLAPTAAGKYAVRSADPLVYNADGSLTLYTQPSQPRNQTLATANWLPTAPLATSTFVLTLRIYNPLPSAYAANHTWVPPPVTLRASAI